MTVGMAGITTGPSLLRHLKRVERRALAVQSMIDDDRDCADILQELCVVRAELRSAMPIIMRICLSKCRPLPATVSEFANERLEKLIEVVSGFMDG